MATRKEQWHARYNLINHSGPPPPAAKASGVKITRDPGLNTNLIGAGVGIKPGAAGSDPTPPSPSAAASSPARLDHLCGGAALPCEGSDKATASPPRSPAAASPKSRTLRAAVDHLHGTAASVRDVEVVATLQDSPPTVSRGLTTKVLKDRMACQQAKEHMMGSCFYKPGTGYSLPEVLPGSEPCSPSGAR